MSRPKIQPLGDSALVLDCAPPATLTCQARIWALAQQCREWAHVIDVVPGMNNLTIVFDALQADPPALARQLDEGWHAIPTGKNAQKVGKTIDIPVRYGGEDGPDLSVVAAHAGMDIEAVARLHAATHYTVYFLGFQPGFAYLGGLDARLHATRRATPRLRVPAGSVAIGGAQTSIYPADSPGGWQVIGRSDVALFDPTRTPASLLQPGDQVRFTIESIAA